MLPAGMLAAGTNMGNIALWKFTPCPPGKKKEGEELWSLQAPAAVEGPVRKVEVKYIEKSILHIFDSGMGQSLSRAKFHNQVFGYMHSLFKCELCLRLSFSAGNEITIDGVLYKQRAWFDVESLG